ncbi:peptidoglycan-binding domain-containing protein [Streptomyces olivaceus]|uniref:peptidoglycan-binding domain-containing protein n=1 Tax=Streptomyces olivaceus TaxID=47716 RepID=UPI001CCA2310|nr:peptidoglycan-binding domain-containing protein [Streptomyces olivaceus]MBZ6283197.1 peptidoglycan-binding protein [Streptomyces olivaceus]
MKKRMAAALGTLVLGTGIALAAPGMAQAASYPTCNALKSVTVTDKLFTYQPYYTGTGSRNCEMSRGAQSDGVHALQNAIRACYRTIASDGIYGPDTEEAVKSVQRTENAGVDGVYGPKTRKAMDWPLYQGGAGFVRCAAPGV